MQPSLVEAPWEQATPSREQADLIAHNVERIARVEQRDRIGMGVADHVANAITAFAGSVSFVMVHVAWFGAWLLLNLTDWAFDPPPFGVLTVIVSLEAIFLSTFVLISQNRQAMQADRRAQVDLQVNLIAEQEVTKLIQLVREVHDYLGIDRDHDPELEHMEQPTHVEKVADAVDEVRERIDPGAAEGPESAVDTEA
jgi:uncharacterized membrane protein